MVKPFLGDVSLQHGCDWEGEDLTGWWATEKINGCRAYWDGQKMWSRSGLLVQVPASFSRRLPPFPIDGELFHPAGAATMGNVMRGHQPGWAGVSYYAFDAPECAGWWPDRIDFIRRSLYWPTFALVPPPYQIESTTQALIDRDRIINRGGEGLVVRHPSLLYTPGRTRQMLKLKILGQRE